MAVFNTQSTVTQYLHAIQNGLSVDPQIATIAQTAIDLANKAFPSSSKSSSPFSKSFFPNCLSPKCPPLTGNPEKREQEAVEQVSSILARIASYFGVSTVSEEILRLDINDPRVKLLYFSADYDWNSALEPKLYPKMLNEINENFDMKFKKIKKFKEICAEIKEATKTGKLAVVVIDSHAMPSGPILSSPVPHDHTKDRWFDESSLKADPSCFEGLEPNGKIFLNSCCTGAPGDIKDLDCFPKIGFPVNPNYKPFAKILADSVKRQVIGAETVSTARRTKITSLDPFMASHPVWNIDKTNLIEDETKNLFRIFHPKNENCRDLNKSKLHHRELSAENVIKSNLVAKSILVDSATFKETQNFFRVCKEDPRDKFLYLVAKDDHNAALDPKNNPDVLGFLADKFDFQYQVVESSKDICKAVDEASKKGKIAAVFIDSHGKPGEGLLLSKDSPLGRITKAADLADCFSSLPKTARIILGGGSSGAPRENDPYHNLAQELASQEKRTVLAPLNSVYQSKLKISSIDPFMVEYPYSISFFSGNSNLFRIFNPLDLKRPDMVEAELNPREKVTANVIKRELVSQSLLSDSAELKETQEFLRLSDEDPREKFLYLSAKDQTPFFIEPHNSKRWLTSLAKQYDLMYKVIRSSEEICKLIQDASKTGKIAGVHVEGNSVISAKINDDFKSRANPTCEDSEYGILLSKDADISSKDQLSVDKTRFLGIYSKEERWNILPNSLDFSECFTGSSPSVRVTREIFDPIGTKITEKKERERQDTVDAVLRRIAEELCNPKF